MSTTENTPIVETCEQCEDSFEVHDSPRPNHCSDECYYTDKGDKALNQIESDHTVCASCHTRIKTIEKPPKGTTVNIPPSDHEQATQTTSNVLIGYQYQTEDTRKYDDAQGDGATAVFYTRWSCECGTVDPNQRDDILEAVDLKATIKNLCERLYDLSRQDAIGGSFSHTRFLEAFQKDERNWAYATGFGLYG